MLMMVSTPLLPALLPSQGAAATEQVKVILQYTAVRKIR